MNPPSWRSVDTSKSIPFKYPTQGLYQCAFWIRSREDTHRNHPSTTLQQDIRNYGTPAEAGSQLTSANPSPSGYKVTCCWSVTHMQNGKPHATLLVFKDAASNLHVSLSGTLIKRELENCLESKDRDRVWGKKVKFSRYKPTQTLGDPEG